MVFPYLKISNQTLSGVVGLFRSTQRSRRARQKRFFETVFSSGEGQMKFQGEKGLSSQFTAQEGIGRAGHAGNEAEPPQW